MRAPLLLILLTSVVTVGENPRRYCGRGLTSALETLCNGVYNTVEVSVTASVPALTMVDKTRSRRQAYTFLPRLFRKRRHGVYDECCRKSCTVTELSSYCGIP